MIKFFTILLFGLFLGTVLHETYHLIVGHGHLIVTSYGIGVASHNGSSEITAYLLTLTCFLLSFYIAVRTK